MVRRSAHGVYNIQHSIDPEMILFGGGISARKGSIGRLSGAYCALVDSLDCPSITPGSSPARSSRMRT